MTRPEKGIRSQATLQVRLITDLSRHTRIDNYARVVGRPDTTRRSSAAKTLIEIPEHKQCLNYAENSVASPTSATSTLCSPIKQESAIQTFPTPDSSTSPEPKGLFQRLLKIFRNPSDDGLEKVRSTAALAAKATLRLGEASNIPYLKGAASILLLILEYAEVRSLVPYISVFSDDFQGCFGQQTRMRPHY